MQPENFNAVSRNTDVNFISLWCNLRAIQNVPI